MVGWPVSRIRWRLASAIVFTALIPLIVGVMLARSLINQSTARFSVPEIGQRLDQSLGLYQELASEVKRRMRLAATAIARRADLVEAARSGNVRKLQRTLERAASGHADLVSLTLSDPTGTALARWDRGRPVDLEREHQLVVRRALDGAGADDEDEESMAAGGETLPSGSSAAPDSDAPAPPPMDSTDLTVSDSEVRAEATDAMLEIVFATPRARFAELEDMSGFVSQYKTITQRRELDDTAYLGAFAVLLGLTILAAIAVGNLMARGVSSRLGTLAQATARAGSGDLSVRVPEAGKDEIAELASAFNRMLEEIESSRDRIEYLQRIATWQEMARRLAHEIKNPLTPIQLAVQELHRRYDGEQPRFRELLDTSVDIVESEVATLRRLVSEFSGFARLPEAELRSADLAAFLREQQRQFAMHEGDLAGLVTGAELGESEPAELEFELPPADVDAPALIDEQMLRRVLFNLIRNAIQATSRGGEEAAPETPRGKVVVRVEAGREKHRLIVEDNGPGIPRERRATVFDPYVTDKRDGTGLGLAIVKKVVVEHKGDIAVSDSPLGGARFEIVLPRVERTDAALEADSARS